MPLRYFLPLLVLLVSALPGRAQFLFQKSIGTALPESASQMIALRSGGYLLAGTSAGPYLVRIDEQGDTLWTRRYSSGVTPGFNAGLWGGGIVENRSGQVLFTCSGYSSNNGRFNYGGILLLVNASNGRVIWADTLQSPYPDYFGTAALANDGNFLLLSRRLGDRLLEKIDSTNSPVWGVPLSGNDTLNTGPVTVLPVPGGCALVNYVPLPASPWRQNEVVFINENGTVNFQKPGFHGGPALQGAIDQQGNLLFANYALSKLTSQGDTLWTKRYNVGGSPVSIYSVAPTPDNNYIALGQRTYQNQTDLVLLKIAQDGRRVRDTILYRPSGSEYPKTVLVDAQGNYVFYGWTSSGTVAPGGTPDLLFAKYRGWRHALGIPEELDSSLEFIDPFPNPTTDQVALKPKRQLNGQLIVRDVLGRLLSRQSLCQTTTATCSLAAYPPGLYLLTYVPQTGAAPRTWRVVRQG